MAKTKDEMLAWIENNTELHSFHNIGSRYCINIKLHSLKLTKEEEDFIYNHSEVVLTEVSRIISFCQDEVLDKYGMHLYTGGRMGGWLYIDETYHVDSDNTHEEIQEVYRACRVLRNTWHKTIRPAGLEMVHAGIKMRTIMDNPALPYSLIHEITQEVL